MPDTPAAFERLPILRELRDQLHAAYLAQEAPSRRGHVRRRWMLPAGGLVAAAVVALVVALTSGLNSGHVVTPEPATAAEVLHRAAAAAEDYPTPFPRADQFFYVRSQGTTMASPASREQADELPTYFVTTETQLWTSIARRGRLEVHTVATTFPNAAERRKWERAGRISPLGQVPNSGRPMAVERSGHYFLGAIKLTRGQLLGFPTDPAVIYGRLRDNTGGRGNSPEGEVFTEIGDALRAAPAPADLRAGLYRALALVPGVRLVGEITDRAGRRGSAVAFTESGVRHELVIDPDTSELLAERDVLVSPKQAELPLPAGTVIGDTVYLKRAVTDTLQAP